MADTAPFSFKGNITDKPVTNHDWSYNAYWDEAGDLISGMNDVNDYGQFTKDFPLLREKTHIDVFVYGTLRKNFSNHRQLGPKAELLGVGHTAYDRFILANNIKAGFPVAYFHSDPTYRAHIYGEVYRINVDQILQLDYLESNGIMFKRHFLPINIVQSNGSIQNHRAWIYLGVKEFWKDRQQALELGRFIKPNNGSAPYYIFTQADET